MIVYFMLEYVWITACTPHIYRPVFESIQKTPMIVRSEYALLAYVTILGTILLICRPLSKQYKPSWIAFSLVGFAIYAVFNFTNAAVFRNYTKETVLLDIAWGTFIFTFLGFVDSLII